MYYYINTEEDSTDIIIKTESLIDTEEFSGTVSRMSDDNKELYCYEIGEYSQQWVSKYFRLLTDEEVVRHLTEYMVNENEDGDLFIVGQCTFTDDGERFSGVVDWQRGYDDTFIGDIYQEDSTKEFIKIDGLERDRIVFLDEEWVKEQHEISAPKFTVIYSEMEDIMTQKYVVKTAQSTDYEYDELVDFVSSLNENPFKINFVFEGHINPYSHE